MKKKLIIICTVCMLISSSLSIHANAEEAYDNTYATVESDVRTEGLIYYYSLYITKQGNTLKIYGTTQSHNIMKTIGFNGIVIEYSSNAVDWYTYDTIPNIYNSDDSVCTINGLSKNVTSGYYYRVKLNHYAKEYGLFGSSQTESNTSNVVC